MIYSRFGTQLTLVSKTESGGRVSVQATTDSTADIHDYNVGDQRYCWHLFV